MTLETATVMVSNSIVTICIWSIGVCGNIRRGSRRSRGASAG